MPAHVHIGTGRFGLGFVGHFSQELCSPRTFLNRTPKTEGSRVRNEKLQNHRQYSIAYYDTNDTEAVTFDSLGFFGPENPESVINVIADPSTDLLTTTVGESQLSEVATLIALGLQKRPPRNRYSLWPAKTDTDARLSLVTK